MPARPPALAPDVLAEILSELGYAADQAERLALEKVVFKPELR